MWTILESPVYRRWWDELTPGQQDELAGRLELLRSHGPTLGRPIVDRVVGSSIHNLKELRAQHKGAQLRVLFVFDPDRQAVLLVGGDKSGGDAEPAPWTGCTGRRSRPPSGSTRSGSPNGRRIRMADESMEFTSYEDTRRRLLTDDERRARIEDARARAVSELTEFSLAELRRALGVTQADLGRRMQVTQPTVSALERSADPRLSSLQRFAEALGGHVRLMVEFDDDTDPVGLDVTSS